MTIRVRGTPPGMSGEEGRLQEATSWTVHRECRTAAIDNRNHVAGEHVGGHNRVCGCPEVCQAVLVRRLLEGAEADGYPANGWTCPRIGHPHLPGVHEERSRSLRISANARPESHTKVDATVLPPALAPGPSSR